MGPQTMYHLIAMDKVAEQHIEEKAATAIVWELMDLLNSHNFKVAITQLSNMQQICNFTML